MTEIPWHKRPDIWKAAHAHIQPELLPFIILSPQDVQEMTEEAIRAADPALKLGELLNSRGLAKKVTQDLHNQARMERDAAMLSDAGRWPMNPIRLKTQPWIEPRRYGSTVAFRGQASCIVIVEGQPGVEEFESIKEMVKVWSVD